MKKTLVKILAFCLVVMFVMSATGCFGSSSSGGSNIGGNIGGNIGSTTSATPNNATDFGDIAISIKSCEITTDSTGKDIAIVTYGFTNNDYDTGMSFFACVNDSVSQNGVELTESNALKGQFDLFNPDEVKQVAKGETIDVKVAYELQDTVSNITVKASKTVSIAGENSTVTQVFTIEQ